MFEPSTEELLSIPEINKLRARNKELEKIIEIIKKHKKPVYEWAEREVGKENA